MTTHLLSAGNSSKGLGAITACCNLAAADIWQTPNGYADDYDSDPARCTCPGLQVREQPRTWDAVAGAAERRHVLLARERDAARTAEREACAQRVFAWAASLSSEHDRLVAAKAAEVVLDPTR